MLYTQYETSKLLLQPLSHYLTRSLAVIEAFDKMFPQWSMLNNFQQAKYALTNNLIKDYPKMPWDLENIVDKDGVSHIVQEQVVIKKTFCEFKVFKLSGVENRPAIFMVAPLSGHYATLLKDTVQTFLKDYDVYITDWLNCRDIPVSEGDFGFEDYVSYVIEFSKYIKDKDGKTNVLAVCQPTVPVAVAAAYLSKFEPEYQFDNIILMGGPLDTRLSPTKVNEYAFNNSLEWFERNVIKNVPVYFKGHGRKVYPGFLQHMGFLSMNMKRHTQAHIDFFNHLLEGADLSAKKHQEFYDEYNAVMDLPAKYYLETLAHVFIDQSLAKDKMEIFGNKISLSDIKVGRYLLLEGELDDISGAGQTHSAYNLLTGLDENHKSKVIARGVGHYGIFSGSGFRNNVYPVLKNFLSSDDLTENVEDKSIVDGDILNIYKTPVQIVAQDVNPEPLIKTPDVHQVDLGLEGQKKLVELLQSNQEPTEAMKELRQDKKATLEVKSDDVKKDAVSKTNNPRAKREFPSTKNDVKAASVPGEKPKGKRNALVKMDKSSDNTNKS